MKLPGIGDIVKAAANPAGFVAEKVTDRVVEHGKDGKPLPEVQAFQVKLDRIAALLAFMAERADPEAFREVFGGDLDANDANADEAYQPGDIYEPPDTSIIGPQTQEDEAQWL